MNYEWFIAKRFLQSQRRGGVVSFITLFSILGITLGTATLIITLSILAGFEKEIKDKVIAFITHIQVHSFNDQPLTYSHERLITLQQNLNGIQSIMPYVAKEGMIRSRKAVDGIYLKGIDLSHDQSLLKRYLKEGKFLDQSTEPTKQIIIGKKLAVKLSVQVGDSVVLFGVSGKSSDQLVPKAMKLCISGIYESGMAEYDDIFAFTDIHNAQELFAFDGKISGYDIMVNDISQVDAITKQLNTELGYPHFARSMFQLYRNLFSWIELQKEMSPILLVLIIIVATVNILGTLLMFVVDKVKEIGILTTLGATASNLRKIFFYQGILISIIGIVLGNILGFVVCGLQLQFQIISLPADVYYMNSVPIELNVINFLLVSIVAFVLSLATTYLPARAASKIHAVSAIKFS